MFITGMRLRLVPFARQLRHLIMDAASRRMMRKYFPPQLGQSDLLMRHLKNGSDHPSILTAFCQRGLSNRRTNIRKLDEQFLLRLLPSVFWNTYRTRNEKSTPPLIESQRVRIQASTFSGRGLSCEVRGAVRSGKGRGGEGH